MRSTPICWVPWLEELPTVASGSVCWPVSVASMSFATRSASLWPQRPNSWPIWCTSTRVWDSAWEPWCVAGTREAQVNIRVIHYTSHYLDLYRLTFLLIELHIPFNLIICLMFFFTENNDKTCVASLQKHTISQAVHIRQDFQNSFALNKLELFFLPYVVMFKNIIKKTSPQSFWCLV